MANGVEIGPFGTLAIDMFFTVFYVEKVSLHGGLARSGESIRPQSRVPRKMPRYI
jgi:hypothetical protein